MDLPHRTMGRKTGRGEALQSVLPRGLVCNRFTEAPEAPWSSGQPSQ